MALLVGPVATNCTRTKPLTVHGSKSLLGIRTLAESNKPIPTRAASLHVPHDSGFRDTAKSRESLQKDFIVYFVAQIANKDVKVI